MELGLKNCGKLNIFREKDLEIGIGDRIKWTKNHKSNDISNNNKKKISIKEASKNLLKQNKILNDRRLNGKYIVVKEIDIENKTAVFEYENGKKENVNLKNKQYLDHSYWCGPKLVDIITCKFLRTQMVF